MTFEEKTIETEMLYRGSVLNLRKDKVTVQNGVSYREIIEHNDGAVIAAVTDEGKMVMVRQYRKPANRVVFEVPAGKIDPGEEPLATAARELKEETGYTADNIEFITSFYPTVGYSEEQLYLFLASGLTAGETSFDENEAIDLEEVEITMLHDMVMKGEIHDAKSMIAILMVYDLLNSKKPQEYMKQL